MAKAPVIKYVRKIRRPVFTTREIAALSGKSLSSSTQSLVHLERHGLLVKIRRGLWADVADERFSPLTLVPYLIPNHRTYVSFLSALHLYGIIEQIPQVTTLASTAHSRTIRTRQGDFLVHRIAPGFFGGFDWYRGRDSFLAASPEKALVDSLYLSVHRKKQYRRFPELHFPKDFSLTKAASWARRIPSAGIRERVRKDLNSIREKYALR